MKILLLDIETAPSVTFTWGLFNQNIGINQIDKPGYTMCFAAKWGDSKTLHFHGLNTEKSEEMVRAAWTLLDEADAVVHYNGSKFDIPTLNREFILHDLPPPSPYKEIDLLRTVRQKFRFTSNKLDFVSQQLGLGSKTKHMGMDLWTACMAGDEKAWRLMKRYNRQDVLLLEKLYHRLLPWIKNHPNWGLYLDADRPTCRNCGSQNVIKRGIERTATQVYQRYACKDCHTPIRGRERLQPTPEGLLV